ncbi:MAG: serine/threonine protein kinase [Planctomycetales bacterium]|nr:serine/threonine protein kinase [Planctomycetales bacterium]
MRATNTTTAAWNCPDEGLWRAFAAAQLPRQRMDELEAHLVHCPTCIELLDSYDQDSDTLIRALATCPGSNDDEPEFCNLEATLLSGADLVGFGDESTLSLAMSAEAGTEPQRELGGYELLTLIGRGGSGAVYQARHKKLDRLVAIKVLNSHYVGRDADALARFHNEMRAIGQLDHRHIVRATDAGEDQGYHYLVMEYVEGLDLSQLLRMNGPLRVADACELIRQAALALDFAHQHNFVHRDVKPSNLLLSAAGTVKLLDLGLAGVPVAEAVTSGAEEEWPHGTADYMSPEQWRHFGQVDARADIYSLGCALFKLLTGRPPYPTRPHDYAAKREAHCHAPIPSVRAQRPEVPLGLQKIITRMLAKQRDDRPGSAAEIAEHLTPYTGEARVGSLAARGVAWAQGQTQGPLRADDESPLACRSITRRQWLAWGGATAASLLVAGVAFARRSTPPPELQRDLWRTLTPIGTPVTYSSGGPAPDEHTGITSEQPTMSWSDNTLSVMAPIETFIDLGLPVQGAFSLRTDLLIQASGGRAGFFFQHRPHKAAVAGKTYPYQVIELILDGSENVRLEWSRYAFYQNDSQPTRRQLTPLATLALPIIAPPSPFHLQIAVGRTGIPQVTCQNEILAESRWNLTFLGREQFKLTRDQIEPSYRGRVGLFAHGQHVEFANPQLRYL